MVELIFRIANEKNPKIEAHSRRVSLLCQRTGIAMGLIEAEICKLKISGMLHDIGKIAIDNSILDKPEKLNGHEWDEIKRHSYIGYRILNNVPGMNEIAEYVLYHHERLDGTGYPIGLKQGEIPLLSRIIAVADAYDAMTSERQYKAVLNKNAAVGELVKHKGTQFDPDIVDIFIEKVLNK
jgi:HD-GYP domain-containing protein (c-di-GMP phosphodiesterase class II)